MNPISASAFTFAAGAVEDATLQDCYRRQGLVVLKGLVEADLVTELGGRIGDLATARLESLGKTARGDLDTRLSQLLAVNQVLAMDIIRALKNMPEFYRAFTDPAITRVAKALLKADVLHCVHDIAQVRIDPPNYHERDFAWHQDFQYNVASLNAVTAWFPITPIVEEMGYLAVIPGSHTRIVPVIEDWKDHTPGRGTAHSTLRLDIDQASLEKDAVAIPDVRPGDIVFFHCLLLHRSGKNRSSRARLVMNPRYAEALDSAVVKRGWVAMSNKKQDVFREFYPDLVRPARPIE